ncbi:GyrI-like domain-containing protein [Microbacterium sp. NPDC057407]|uniref:GyrI-like domain-containing protein n=1 Tax=Microbacterium sp. NPDC057407 TaxID=3346120 RepID=UPI00366DA5ED
MDVKLDLKREIAGYAARRGSFQIVDVEPQQYLMVDGSGDPNASERYRDAVSTLFGVAYAVKFLSKRELGRDHVVMPLEALWWADDMASFTSARDKTRWSWTAMILVPDWIEGAHVDRARATAAAKGAAPLGHDLRLQTLAEGLCVQTLHVGSYDDEAPVLRAMHEQFIPAQGLRMTGRHHEIYLSDARRTAPEKLRTILRQPVEEA